MGMQLHRIRAALLCGAALLGACSEDLGEQGDGNGRAGVGGTAAGGGSAGTSVATAGTGLVAGRGAAGTGAAGIGAAGTLGIAGRGPAPAAGSGALPAPAGTSAPLPPVAGAGPAAGSGGMAVPPAPMGPPGTWPAADPAKKGPLAVTTETMVGPGMAFTMYRPMMLTQRHPVITWGNGTGTTPPTYRSGLELYASHGFIVIASNSMNVGQGTPPPMLDGVTWVLAQDMTEGSPLFGKVDRERIGATGHSQGAFATSRAGMDPRIKTIAPIQSLGGSRGFHGPVLGICGTMDATVPCSGNLRSYMGIADQPAMYAESLAATHTNWMFSLGGGAINPIWIVTNAWFRVHLMDDKALRPMFYGADCSVCKDTATWTIMRQRMDN